MVVVSNAYQNDVLPTSSEVNLYGGIYREVELIVTEQTTVSPLYYGSDGVLINQLNFADNKVDATASVWVTSTLDRACDLYITVRAPTGEVVYSRYLKGRIEEGRPIDIPFSIDEPLLWSCEEPNLYTVTIGIGPRQEDEVTVTTGFRQIDFSSPSALKINGRRVPIHGVTLYHDRAAIASARARCTMTRIWSSSTTSAPTPCVRPQAPIRNTSTTAATATAPSYGSTRPSRARPS